jgi:hypothetical protein
MGKHLLEVVANAGLVTAMIAALQVLSIQWAIAECVPTDSADAEAAKCLNSVRTTLIVTILILCGSSPAALTISHQTRNHAPGETM